LGIPIANQTRQPALVQQPVRGSSTSTPVTATDCDTNDDDDDDASSPRMLRTLYPPLQAFQNGTCVVDSIHTLYYEQYGCPQGIPALVLHGGPGAGCFSRHAQFFDPTRYHIVLFDQRGSGQSTPRGEVQNNTLSHLIQDCETLRHSPHEQLTMGPRVGWILGIDTGLGLCADTSHTHTSIALAWYMSLAIPRN
jgi:pimeloyl-ACP methyl ester carboxylesterase